MAVYSKPNTETGIQDMKNDAFAPSYPRIGGIDPQTDPFGTKCWYAAVLTGWRAILLIASHVQFTAES
jgi:hypothetical protein